MDEQQQAESPVGYPLSDIPRRYGATPYILQDFELESIRQVKKCLARKSFYSGRESAEEHLIYLESLAKKISMILDAEMRDGLTNWELQAHFREIGELCRQLESVIIMNESNDMKRG